MIAPADRTLRLRAAARALLVDEHDHLLLVRYEFPTARVWGLPGGGLDPGEDALAGLRRELREELGLREVAIGPHIWNRDHVFPMHTGHDGQRDQIFLTRVDRFDPVPDIGWDALRDEFVHELRWWSLDQIGAATPRTTLDLDLDVDGGVAGSSRPTWFAPRRLAELARHVLTAGPPAEPIDTGV